MQSIQEVGGMEGLLGQVDEIQRVIRLGTKNSEHNFRRWEGRLEGLPAGDPRCKLGSTTTNADLRVRKPINCSQVSRSRSAPLASARLPRLHIWRNAATSGPSAMEHSLTPWPAAWENSTAPEDRKDKVIRAPRELKERSKRERP